MARACPGTERTLEFVMGRSSRSDDFQAAQLRTIDADGLVVSPGFIDHHTHMDAQLFWDPFATCEPQNGVTTAIMGNCALTLAPVKDGDEDPLVSSFVRVEAMPRPALSGWDSVGLAQLW